MLEEHWGGANSLVPEAGLAKRGQDGEPGAWPLQKTDNYYRNREYLG